MANYTGSDTSLHVPAITKILGSSAGKSAFYTLQDNLVAYVAGGGVVVCKIDHDTGRVGSQRFFCVNSNDYGRNNATLGSSLASSSANAYVNMIRKGLSFHVDHSASSSSNYPLTDDPRDSFGYPVTVGEPVISGSNSAIHLHRDLESLADSAALGGSGTGGPAAAQTATTPSKFKDRVRSINCLAISPDKTVLAIGEVGYHPRIALFSLAPDLLQSPFALIYEHSFGINTISFSLDLKTFCSLGLLNDGFLNIWKVAHSGDVSLQASNKCTSVVNKLIWHERYIVSLGLRMVKVWRYDQPTGPTRSGAAGTGSGGTILKGKNVLLGHLLNCNFVGGDSLNGDEVLIYTDTSQMLLLKLNYESLQLVQLDSATFGTAPFAALCVDYDNEQVWFEDEQDGAFRAVSMGDLRETAPCGPAKTGSASRPSSPTKLSALGSIFGGNTFTNVAEFDLKKLSNFNGKFILHLSKDHELTLFNKQTGAQDVLVGSLIKNLSGIKSSFLNDILVFSNEGNINKIDPDCENVSFMCKISVHASEVIGNTLTSVDLMRTNNNGSLEETLVYGDKMGTINVGILKDNQVEQVYSVKAHTSSVNEVIFFNLEFNTYICSISRDRMIQIFRKPKLGDSNWDLLQTLPTHSGNVLKIFHHDGKLYTCSADRTVSIHKVVEESAETVTIIQEKVISLKNTPVAIKVHGSELIVSSSDKTLLIYNVDGGYEQARTLKLFNANESLLVENFVIHNNFIITASSDKSLRIFNFQLGRPISVYWGHLDSIISLNLVSNYRELITISLDGCLFKWNLVSGANTSSNTSSTSSLKLTSPTEAAISPKEFTPLYAKVTRKIIPNVVMSSTKSANPGSLTPNSSRRGSISSPYKEMDDNGMSSPSPAPKLSAATLKRMESKKALVPAASDLASPSKDLPRSRSASPRRSSLSPSKQLPGALLSSATRKRMLLDISKSNPLGPEKNGYTLLPSKEDGSHYMERSLAHLAMVKTGYTKHKLSETDRDKLRRAIAEIQGLLESGESMEPVKRDPPPPPAQREPEGPQGPESSDNSPEGEHQVVKNASTRKDAAEATSTPKTTLLFENMLLEKYSDKLVELVHQKLSIEQTYAD